VTFTIDQVPPLPGELLGKIVRFEAGRRVRII
jgi:hypothetical protein